LSREDVLQLARNSVEASPNGAERRATCQEQLRAVANACPLLARTRDCLGAVDPG